MIIEKIGVGMGNSIGISNNNNIKIKQFIKADIVNYQFLNMVLGDGAEAGLCDPTVKRRDWKM
jgi:hypothetical protein